MTINQGLLAALRKVNPAMRSEAFDKACIAATQCEEVKRYTYRALKAAVKERDAILAGRSA